MKTLTPAALLRILLLIAVPLFFTFNNRYFLTSGNLFALMQSFALVGLVAVGLALTMIVGEFDLSIAPVVSVGGLILAKMGGDSAIIGVCYACAFGLAIGMVNALLVVKLKVSSLVSTLGMMILLSGFAFWIADGNVVPYYNFDASDMLNAPILTILSPRILITIAIFFAIYLVLSFTRTGRDIFATGSHRQSAMMSGANTTLAIFFAFGCSGLFSALAGALMSVSLATGSPTLGDSLLIQAASAAILGGVALTGGVGKAQGIATGVFILAALNNGLSLSGVSSAVSQLVNGAVLGIVVLINGDFGHAMRHFLRRTRPQ